MNAEAELVVQELLSQITALSRERAVLSALVKQYQQELAQARQELETLRKERESIPAE